MRSFCRLSTILVSAFLLSAALWAQFDTGSITGSVTDPAGSAVPGAKITLVNAATGVNLSTLTNENGIYEFANVRVGAYQMTAEKTGFSMAHVEEAVVSVSSRTRQDLRLAVGEVTQTVDVAGETPLVESETSQRGQVIGGNATVELPLNGREYSSLPAAHGRALSSPPSGPAARSPC